MRMYAARLCCVFLVGPCRKNEFQLSRLRPANNFPVWAEALLHPSLLTTLVYRFGIPGKVTRNRHQVLANGQCFISPRETLLKTDAFRAAQLSLCEDVTIARRLAECGEAIGFYESDGLARRENVPGIL